MRGVPTVSLSFHDVPVTAFNMDALRKPRSPDEPGVFYRFTGDIVRRTPMADTFGSSGTSMGEVLDFEIAIEFDRVQDVLQFLGIAAPGGQTT